MRKGHLTLKIFALIMLNDLWDTLAQLLMKAGLAKPDIGPVTFGNIADFVLKNMSSPVLWLGIIIYTLNFFIWIAILYKIDLSIAVPVGSASYILIPICAAVFLHEHVSLMRWLGVLLIVAGVHFVSQSRKPAKENLMTW